MLVKLRSLSGVGAIPRDRSSISSWFRRSGIATYHLQSIGGVAEVVQLSDLPEPERLAFLRRELDAAGLDLGQRDDDAHDAYVAAKP